MCATKALSYIYRSSASQVLPRNNVRSTSASSTTVEYDFGARMLGIGGRPDAFWDVIIRNLCQDYRTCKNILNKLEFVATNVPFR